MPKGPEPTNRIVQNARLVHQNRALIRLGFYVAPTVAKRPGSYPPLSAHRSVATKNPKPPNPELRLPSLCPLYAPPGITISSLYGCSEHKLPVCPPISGRAGRRCNHVGPDRPVRRPRRLCRDDRLWLSVRADLSAPMIDLLVGGIVSAGLLVYLVWALLRPEDF